jgi:predicted metal-dependent peptidase
MESLELRLETSASKVSLRVPFIMAATGRLPRQVVEDPHMTACTNGQWFRFGRKWVEENVVDDEELFGLDLHERMHVVLMHMWRREGRDMGIWNVANDAIINATIIAMGYKLPKGGVHIPWVNDQMGSEEVYQKLMEEMKNQPKPQPGKGGKGDGQGQGSPGDADGEGEPGDSKGNGSGKPKHDKYRDGGWGGTGDLEDAPDDASVADMEATIRAAAQMARDCGDGSSLVNRILGTTPKATVNWKDEVRAALTSSARDDFSFRRLSRRFIGRGMYMPSLRSDAMGGLLIGFDTSGSMSKEDCDQVAGEIQGIVDDLSPDWVEVVYCDSTITSVQRFDKGDELMLVPTGGGGTAFLPVFKHADKLNEQGDKVAALIYLTDMEGNLKELDEPEFPVVWGCVYQHRDMTAPFGSVVKVVV